MTTAMILSLVVLVAMVAMIMFDVLPFGMPPIAACVLIVLFGLGDVGYAFAASLIPQCGYGVLHGHPCRHPKDVDDR